MLISPREIIAECVEKINEGYFYLPAHQAIYTVLVELWNAGQGIDLITFTQVLRDRGIKISMDGKGRFIDNIFVERLWRSLKYEEVYLNPYDSLCEGRMGIGRYFNFYNDERPHQALGYQTPSSFYDGLRRIAT